MSHALIHRERQPTTFRAFGEAVAAAVTLNAIGAGAGLLAGSGDDSGWYSSLEKPSFQPPSGIFAPVWTLLYTLMGVSLSILWRARGAKPAANPAVQLFTIQYLLNLLWSFLFFRRQNPRAAFIEILVMNAVIALTIFAAWRVSKLAALLLVPYLLWAMFAALLNGSIWRLNR